MKIDRLTLGAYETNCYVLRDGEAANDCLIIDPGLEAEVLVDFLRDHKLNPVAVVLTHGHIDHIAGVVALRDAFPDVKVSIHELDAVMLSEPHANLSVMSGMVFSTHPPDVSLQDGDIVNQAGIELLVLHTPGHTPGGICLCSKVAGIAFVGDTLFAGSVGRADFPGGSMYQLINSVKEKLFTLPGETKVYPGHGPPTTIAHEKNHNPFF
ncbi:MAG TPA: MBL fold metallo-hydrolase [Sedimentisphaerales bacterium]|nr:MBL fold metallo-hydrolase [Sedimentisphaerales bacterium]